MRIKRYKNEHAGHTLSQIECGCPKLRQMALSYWIRVAEHLNRPETDYLGEKVQESVCPANTLVLFSPVIFILFDKLDECFQRLWHYFLTKTNSEIVVVLTDIVGKRIGWFY